MPIGIAFDTVPQEPGIATAGSLLPTPTASRRNRHLLKPVRGEQPNREDGNNPSVSYEFLLRNSPPDVHWRDLHKDSKPLFVK